MPEPGVPEKLEELAGRAFSFFPPILNIEHNEWSFVRETWSEVLVANAKTGQEIWIPRRLIGELSHVDRPVMIVGLRKELEYAGGTVWPHERRVIEMPAPPAAVPSGPPQNEVKASVPAPHPPSTESRIGKLIGIALGTGILFCVLVIALVRIGPFSSRVVFTSADQDFLELSRQDDYFSVVRKLGKPAEERRRTAGDLEFQLLWYPQRSYSVILMGTERKDVHYIGALDKNWHVVHYVSLSQGRDTASMLRNLPKF